MQRHVLIEELVEYLVTVGHYKCSVIHIVRDCLNSNLCFLNSMGPTTMVSPGLVADLHIHLREGEPHRVGLGYGLRVKFCVLSLHLLQSLEW